MKAVPPILRQDSEGESPQSENSCREIPCREVPRGKGASHLAEILDALPSGVALVDKDGFLRFNRSAQRLLGLAGSSYTASTFEARYPAFRDDGKTPWPAAEWPIVKALRGETCPEAPMVIRPAGRAQIVVGVSAKPLMNELGETDGALVIFRDITETLRGMQAIRRQARMLEALAEGVHVCDDSLTIEYTNPAFDRMFGYERGELVGCHVSVLNDLEASENERYLEETLEALNRDGCWRGEIRNRKKDGTTFFTRARIAVEEISGRRYYIAVQEDVTEARRAQRELEITAAQLRRSNADLEKFAYIVSHDLTEPLRMVTSFVALLRRRYHGKLDRDADEFINFAIEGATRMKALIEGLLNYSRVGTKGAQFELVDTKAVADHVAMVALRAKLAESGARLCIGDLPPVWGDPVQVGQLFQNLLANAIQYRDASRPCEIHVSGHRAGAECIFSVRDNGIGLEMQYADRIFQIFQRLHGPGAFPGSGLGLAICKRITDRHGGRIWVESTPGHGSTFFFSLPAPQANP